MLFHNAKMAKAAQLRDAWGNWTDAKPPHILDADRDILERMKISRNVPNKRWTAQNWAAAFSAEDFGCPGDTRLHLGLLPVPFVGDLRNASIFILMLNPGLGFGDYYAEYEVPKFRRALVRNLRQDFSSKQFPFLFLDPQFSWHGGFSWWHGRLAGTINELHKRHGIPFSDARKQIARRLAAIQLVPYHSEAFSNSGGLIERLPSAQLAKDFVKEFVMPKVERREAIAIVTRQARAWGLPKRMSGVIIYDQHAARAAHLSPKSDGGNAILRHLAIAR
jgi:hypothetical protein